MVEIRTAKELNKKYLREEMWPTIFCNGCGNGVVLEYTFWALEELDLDMDKVVFASGIGCSSRLPGYINADGLHTTHGRAIAFSTGVKAANPDLKLIVFTGDGDCAGIGGNHFIHAARRNIDMTVIMINNFIYGMTGGQLAPTAPLESRATTAPYGNIEPPFDICKLAKSLGANYVARWSVTHPYQPIKSVKKALEKKGFSLIEFLAPCPTAYGRRNKLGDIKKQWEWYDKNTILIEDYKRIMKYGSEKEKEEIKDMFPIGVFQDIEKPGLFERYEKLVEQVMGKNQKSAGKKKKGSVED